MCVTFTSAAPFSYRETLARRYPDAMPAGEGEFCSRQEVLGLKYLRAEDPPPAPSH